MKEAKIENIIKNIFNYPIMMKTNLVSSFKMDKMFPL